MMIMKLPSKKPLHSILKIAITSGMVKALDFFLGKKIQDDKKYKIAGRHFGIEQDVFLDEFFNFEPKSFIAVRDISIFRKLGSIIKGDIVVSDDEGAIPLEEYQFLLENFPTTGELNRYSDNRVARVLRDYLPLKDDFQWKFDKALNKRKKLSPKSHLDLIGGYEAKKYEYLISVLESMLSDSESYVESDWQKLIVEIVLFIFPKYVYVLEEVPVRDRYTDPNRVITRRVDLGLVDANGYLDVIEIKRPFEKSLLSVRKYRDSFVPKKELSGTILQAEKYLFHLSKGGRGAETLINEQYQNDLPDSFEVKITNPKAIIISGRDYEFSDAELFDFEVIKRKYANVVDILTYDDLLRRLKNLKDKYSR